MRSTTMMRALRVGTILAGLVVLPQFASAQLPIETKQIKLQNNAGDRTLTLTAPGVSADYTLTFPNVQGTQGGFLYLANSDGQLAFASTADLKPGSTPVWDDASKTIKWEDPNGANNPNWSRSGNAISGTGKLGATTGQGFNIVTNDLVRIGFSSDGNVTINTVTDGTTTIGSFAGNDVNIGNSTGDVAITGSTTVVGTLTVNDDENNAVAINGGTSTGSVTIGGGASTQTIAIGNGGGVKTVTLGSTNTTSVTNINGGSDATGAVNIAADTIVSTGGFAHTGTLNLSGANSDLKMANDPGASGEVLVSKGNGLTPEWQNLNESIGIRSAGVLSIASGNSIVVQGIVLTATDAIVITLGGSTSVVAVVTSRTNSTNESTTNGTFTVTFSGTYAGSLNYIVMKQSTIGTVGS